MGNSLFDQLKKSGLVDEKKASKIKKEKYKQTKQQKGQQTSPEDDSKRLAQQALAKKAEKDRVLNEQRKQEAEKKAIAAQIKQLVEMNPVASGKGDIRFNFTADKKVQRLYVTETQQGQLVRGQLAIVRLEGKFHLTPAGVAEKIQQRDPAYVILRNTAQAEDQNEDDPYAAYQVPDDLMW